MIRIISLELLGYEYNPERKLKINQEEAKCGRYYGKNRLEFRVWLRRVPGQEWGGTGKKMDKG